MQAAESLWEEAGPAALAALAAHAGYGLVLCGHSLGAGAAAALAVLLKCGRTPPLPRSPLPRTPPSRGPAAAKDLAGWEALTPADKAQVSGWLQRFVKAWKGKCVF